MDEEGQGKSRKTSVWSEIFQCTSQQNISTNSINEYSKIEIFLEEEINQKFQQNDVP